MGIFCGDVILIPFFIIRTKQRVRFHRLCAFECWLKWHHCLPWACSLARLWLGGERNTIATTASWWIKAIIGKRKSLWLHTNTHACKRPHARTHPHAHLINCETAVWRGQLTSGQQCYRSYYTTTCTQSHSQSLGSPAGIQHGCLSLAEIFPFASIGRVNQHCVESHTAH